MSLKKQFLTAIKVVVAMTLYFLPVPFLTWSLSWFLNWLFVLGRVVGCIFVQAFGRNTFLDDELVAILGPMREKANDDPIKVFLALKEMDFDPGKPNMMLANIVLKLRLIYPVPVIAQWEVVYALWQIEPKGCEQIIKSNQMFTLWPRGNYYPTYEVKKDSIEIMRRWELSNPLELAHPDQAARAVAILLRLGVDPSLYIAWVSFDRRSVQKWTRNVLFWGFYEIAVRFHHLIRGWVVFWPPKE